MTNPMNDTEHQIVAWLRKRARHHKRVIKRLKAVSIDPTYTDGLCDGFVDAADAIERGEHRNDL